MENHNRDKLSQSRTPTDAGDVNRETSAREGRENDSSADFGQSVGRAEEMKRDDDEEKSGTGWSPGRH